MWNRIKAGIKSLELFIRRAWKKIRSLFKPAEQISELVASLANIVATIEELNNELRKETEHVTQNPGPPVPEAQVGKEAPSQA
jgi:hypothetical protein